ncbi:unnamed protein product [Malus baccata var. baccata]
MFGETEYDPTRQFCSIPIGEQLDALGRAVDSGKVAERSTYRPKIVSLQNAYSLLCRTFDSGLAECCHHERIRLLAYSPLAMGILSGKYFSPDGGPPDARLNVFRGKYSEGESRYNLSNHIIRAAAMEYIKIAEKYSLHPVSLAIAFVLSRSLVASVVFGATKSWQLQEVLDGCKVELTPEVIAEINKPWLFPAPTYRTLETFWDCDDDAPGPRCSHTLTAVAATKTHGPRLILFGGATAIEGGAASSAPGIRLAGVTNSVHSYDILTRKWTRYFLIALLIFGFRISKNLLELKWSLTDRFLLSGLFQFCRMRPAGEPPSPRAAHAAAAVGTMVVFQGGIGPAGHSTDDLYVLDLANDKFKWHRVVVQGQGPGPRYGHVMDLVAQRYLVTVSGNDGKRIHSDAWALDTAQKPYAWARLNPEGDRPSARMYATASSRSDGMFLLCGGRDISGTPLADAYGLLMHRNGQWEWTLAPGVSPSPRYQHAAVFVGARLHVTGGALRGGRGIEGEAAIAVLDTAAGVWLDRNGLVTSSRTGKGQNDHDPSLELMRRSRHAAASLGVRIYIYGGLKGDILLDDFLIAENSSVQSEGNSPVLTSERSPTVSSPRMFHADTRTFGTSSSDGEPESPSSTGLSMDKNSMEKLREASAAEAEAASAVWQAVQSTSATPSEETSVSDDNSQVAETLSDGSDTEADVRLHHRAVVVAKEAVGNLGGMVISTLLRPRNWKPPVNRKFFLDSYEVGELCYAAEQIFMHEQTVLQLKAPVKIEYPDNVHLIRGNHEAADINALFGFRIECIERMGENDGIWAWTRFNQLFNYLPLAALIEKKIICMHGGIGRSINSVEQIEKLERPITMDAGSIILMDLLWSDPTENDSVEGLRPNARGPGLVTFGPDRVAEFCKRNKLQLIVRAHECVMDGFERFAQGQLITLFSATNYCGTANNAGAILVVGRGLVVVPKLIHPLPPPLQSPETSPERVIDDTWMQSRFHSLLSSHWLQILRQFSSASAIKPTWNSKTNVIITNPTLQIMESCTTMLQLKQIQAQMTTTGLITHTFPVSRVLAFCALADGGDIRYAHVLFTQIGKPNTYMWNTMIRGYSKAQIPAIGFSFFGRMVREGVEMDSRSFVFALKVCGQFGRVLEGDSIHCMIWKMGFDSDLLVRNGLLHYYAEGGFLSLARKVFDESSARDVVTWTAMIDGYAGSNCSDEAMELFGSMLLSNVEPNEVTMIAVLSACSERGDIGMGKSVHEYIQKKSVNCSLNLLNALLDMYVKCGCLLAAQETFDNMKVRDVFSWTSMVNGYAKCGDLDSARKFFDDMPERNVVSWNAMIAGYTQNNRPNDALKLFYGMVESGMVPTEDSLVCALSACGQLGCLRLGKVLFGEQSSSEEEDLVSTSDHENVRDEENKQDNEDDNE